MIKCRMFERDGMKQSCFLTVYNGTFKCDNLDNLTTLTKTPLFSWPILVFTMFKITLIK